MSNLVKLEDVASIQIGYQHRGKIAMSSVGSHKIIQVKDIAVTNELWTGSLYMVTPRGETERYLVSKGDVLFLSRGHRVLAVPVLEQLKNTIAAYYFYIVRVHTENLLPEYLAWFINQRPAQMFLEKRMRGSHIKMVPKSAFASLEINMPSVATQKTIVELERLSRKEEICLTNLARARKRMVQALSLKSARKT